MFRTRSLKITPNVRPYETGDNPGANPDDKPDLQAQIEAAVAKATEGLTKTNKALKEEKVKAKEQLEALLGQFDTLGGADGVKALMEQRKKLMETEEGKLLTEGKHQEWLDLKTTALRKDHENQTKALLAKAEQAEAKAAAALTRVQRTKLMTDVAQAQIEAKTRMDSPSLAEDILNAAEKVFTYDPERDMNVIKDEDEGVVFGKDGKTPKTVTEWLQEQQESRRHWWGDSVGGGARGSQNGGGFANNPWTAEHWNLTEQGKVITTRGPAVAEKMAAAAGSKVGAVRPAGKKS